MPTHRAHSVHLTAPTEALLRRGTLLLEDALHTASLPEGSRLLLIRRLDVGRIQPRRSPAALALTIEQQMQRVIPIPARNPAAATAAAVTFEDPLEPYTLLCQTLAQGHRPSAWFWAAAVPQWRPHQSPQETYRQILFHLAQQPQGVLALAQLLHHLQQHHALTPLLTTLTPLDATTLRTLTQLPSSSLPSPIHPSTHPPIHPSTLPLFHSSTHLPSLPLLPTLQTQLLTWGPTDPRSHWLTLTALIHAIPARILSPDLPVQTQNLIDRITDSASPRVFQDGRPEDELQPTQDQRQKVDQLSPSLPLTSLPLPSPCPPPPLEQREAEPHSPSPYAAIPDWLPTPYGGFFFTINLLTRLGFPQYLATHPHLIETHYPTLLLQALAHRLTIPPEDPIHQTLTPPTSPTPPTTHPWLRLLHRWCRCYLNTSLATLVARPGELRATPTHIDLRFDLNHSDIRLRRTGLDLDPGWVPWLGRVITFHYHGGSIYAL